MGEDYDMLLNEFEPKTRARILEEVERRVQETYRTEEKKLSERKERLRKLYEKEAKTVIPELSYVGSEDRYDQMIRKIMEVETQKERERLEIVEQKRKQQKFLNCEEIRSILSKQQDKAVKMDQLWQINQKLAFSKEKAKEDQHYHQLILQKMRDSIKLEEESNKMKWQNEICIRNGYEEQIEYKNIQKQNEIREKEKESLQLQLLIHKNKEIEMKEMEEKRRKCEELAKEMKMLKERESLVRQERLKEEKVMQEQIELIAFTDQKLPDKAKLKEELESYRCYLQELSLKRKAEEQRFQTKLTELTKELESKQETERRKMDFAREELKQSVLRCREEQLCKRYETEKAEKLQAANETCQVLNEVSKFQIELEKNKQLIAEKKQEYRQQLLKQMQEREEAKVREKKEKLKEKEVAEADEEKFRQELEGLVLKPPATNRHPLQGVEQAAHFIPPNL